MLTAIAANIDPIYIVALAVLSPAIFAKAKFYKNQTHSLVPYLLLFAFLTPPAIDVIISSSNSKSKIEWNDFKPKEIQQLVQDGNSVFVYMTAEWCITCKVNEKTTLANNAVIEKLNEIHSMKADWTRPDAEISDFLKSNSRYGIPFSIVYSRTNPNGKVLPELLTPSIIMEAIEK